ncbi:hypothetical protein PR048_033500 [Dryococelus australis]|uniref:Uncharacterized protein n=1 Tax=Dryococelus australis TaxID=614101 RepID=A0ABQ9G3A3_9NEOP|nr:hypothetical protein PR048_033500 [Dryococelus australis]
MSSLRQQLRDDNELCAKKGSPVGRRRLGESWPVAVFVLTLLSYCSVTRTSPRTCGHPSFPDPFRLKPTPAHTRQEGMFYFPRVPARAADKLLASRQGEPCSIPGLVTPGFPQVGIVSDDAACQRVFSGISRFPPPLHSGATPFSPHFTLIGSQYLVKSRPRRSEVCLEQRLSERGGGNGRYLRKPRQPATSSGTIPTCENLAPPGIEPSLHTTSLAVEWDTPICRAVERVLVEGTSLMCWSITSSSRTVRTDRGRPALRMFKDMKISRDKIGVKHVYTEVGSAFGSQFIRHALDDSEQIADLQGNKRRVSYCQIWAAPKHRGLQSRLWGSEVRMQQRRNARTGETGDPRENPLISGIAVHYSHLRRARSGPSGIEPGSHGGEASSLTA